MTQIEEKILDLKKKVLAKQMTGFQALIELNQVIAEQKEILSRITKNETSERIIIALEKVQSAISGMKPVDIDRLVGEIKRIKINPEIRVTLSSLNRVEDLLLELTQAKPEKIDINTLIKWPSKPNEAIPVVLTKTTLTEFYNAIVSTPMFSGGVSVDTSKLATAVLQQQIIDAINNIPGGGGGTGDASAANQVIGNNSLSSIDVKIGEVQTDPTAFTILDRLKSLYTAITSTLTINLPSGAATAVNQQTNALTNSELRAAPVTVNTGLSPIEDGGDVNVTNMPAEFALPASQVISLTPPPAITNYSLETSQIAQNVLIGAVDESAPTTDTASSGLNGRLQRIAQRITSLISAVGSPFQAGGSIGNTTFSSTQSGTWTVQPGNTPNTTAWKVDGSAVTQPVSGTITANPTSPATILNGQKLVTTAGTRVTLASSTTIKSVTIKALSTNTGIVYVGNATVSSSNGLQLVAGDSVSLDISNLATINLDASVSGEGATYLGVV